MKPTFVTIGDTVNDVFIKLKDAHIHQQTNESAPELALRYSEKVAFESATQVNGVGNSPNAAVCASRLNLNTYLISAIGNDEEGEKALAALGKEALNLDYIKKSNTPTNFHYVLWFKSDRTILVKHENHEYHFPIEIPNIDWIYLSSLGEHLLYVHDEIISYLDAHPKTKLTFQPGTYQMKLGIEKLSALYKKTYLFVCNVEEAEQILNIPNPNHVRGTNEFNAHVVDMMKKLASYGPQTISISDGPNGAFAFDGEKSYFLPIYPDPKEPLERTGAGDSFASTFSSYLAKGFSFTDSLLRAPINSMNVVQYIGAQEGLLTEEKLEEYLKNAPDNYKVVTL